MGQPESFELDVGRSEKKLWLVKVPNFVAKKWHEVCKASAHGQGQVGPELGRVTISSGAIKSDPSCTLRLTGPAAEGLPKEFNLRASTESQAGLQAFGSEPGHMSVVGKIDQRFDTEMRQGQAAQELDPEYRKLSRERNKAAETKHRTAQVIAPQSATMRVSASPHFVREKRKLEAARYEKRFADKRVRMDREQLESLLFRLFERQDFWNFQALVTETDQPVAWLKEVLLALAVQNKKPGPHRDHWHLKPEYRTRQPVDV